MAIPIRSVREFQTWARGIKPKLPPARGRNAAFIKAVKERGLKTKPSVGGVDVLIGEKWHFFAWEKKKL